MRSLVIHVGPGKCGSSTIQHFFATTSNPCIQSTRYIGLAPSVIDLLNCDNPLASAIQSLTELLAATSAECDAIVLSHEYLFQRPLAVQHLCDIGRGAGMQLVIVGYSRRQSDFLVSAYSQWWSRSQERTQEVSDVVDGMGLEGGLFSGLERQLIASIANDFFSGRQLSGYSILDWHANYGYLSRKVHGSGARIKVGVLPLNKSAKALVQDFCEKAGLTLRQNADDAHLPSLQNEGLDQDLVEAVNNAVLFGLSVPGPHQANDALRMLSAHMGQATSASNDFLSQLKSYVDTYYEASNRRLCSDYHLAADLFTPAMRFSKPEILAVIAREGQERQKDCRAIVHKYRMLTARMAELCIKMAQAVQ